MKTLVNAHEIELCWSIPHQSDNRAPQGATQSGTAFGPKNRLLAMAIKLSGSYISRFRPPVCLMPTPSRSRSRSLPRVPTSLSWGSDWPHVATYGPMPNLSSLDLLADWAPRQPLPGMCELPQKCSASLLSPSDGRCLADSTVKSVFSADHGMYAGLIRRLKVRARLADRLT